MPAIKYADHLEMYSKAFSVLLRLSNSAYSTRPICVLVVDKRQLAALAEQGLVPCDQLDGFKRDGLLLPIAGQEKGDE